MGKWRNPRENKGEHIEKEGILTEDREDLRLVKLMEHDTKPWRTEKTNGLKTICTMKVKENHEKRKEKLLEKERNYWKMKRKKPLENEGKPMENEAQWMEHEGKLMENKEERLLGQHWAPGILFLFSFLNTGR